MKGLAKLNLTAVNVTSLQTHEVTFYPSAGIAAVNSRWSRLKRGQENPSAVHSNYLLSAFH